MEFLKIARLQEQEETGKHRVDVIEEAECQQRLLQMLCCRGEQQKLRYSSLLRRPRRQHQARGSELQEASPHPNSGTQGRSGLSYLEKAAQTVVSLWLSVLLMPRKALVPEEP